MEKKNKVLVIDDEPVIGDMFKLVLNNKKYQVITSYNGADGIKKALKKEPDLIVLDLGLPSIDGFEILGILKNNSKTANIPIIICSGHSKMSAKQSSLTSIPMKSSGCGNTQPLKEEQHLLSREIIL